MAQQQQNPFGQNTSGANAFKAAYDRLKAEADARKQGISQDYSSAYQQLRGQTYTQGLGAAAQRGLSGGQAAGARSAVGAQQMGALGNLMQGQERALREAKVGEGSIYSNALLEGQQAQQYEQSQEQYNYQRQQQINTIQNDKTLTPEQKRDALVSLGINQDQASQSTGLADEEKYGKDRAPIRASIFMEDIQHAQNWYTTSIANAATPEEKASITQQFRQSQERSLTDIMRVMRITREQAIARLQRKGITLI
jgi:hypothetical protein